MSSEKKRKQNNVSMEMKLDALKRLDKGESINDQLLGEDEIVALVREKKAEDEQESEDEEMEVSGKVKKKTHSEGLKAVEGTLRYFEEHGASAMEILLLRRLHDKAASRCIASEKQSRITSFFSKKD